MGRGATIGGADDDRRTRLQAQALSHCNRHGDLGRAGVEGTLLVALEAELPVMRVREGLSSLRAAEVVVVMNSVQGVWPLRTLLAASGAPLAQWSDEGHPALASLNDIVARLLGEPAY